MVPLLVYLLQEVKRKWYHFRYLPQEKNRKWTPDGQSTKVENQEVVLSR
jgi:hypothetical protein